MVETNVRQRLAVILAADVVSYSRLMSKDERATVAALDSARGIFREFIATHQGRVIDMAGDSVLAVFDTATGAVAAALAIQEDLFAMAAAAPEDLRMRFRIGVHLGDVMEKTDGTVYGDGVNIAARLEGLAEAGGITVSGAVRGAVRGKLRASFIDLGERRLKNIAEPVNVFRIRVAGAEPVPAKRSNRKRALIITLATAALGIGAGVYYAWQPPAQERTRSIPTTLLTAEQKQTDEKAAAEKIQIASAASTPNHTEAPKLKPDREGERSKQAVASANERAVVAAAAPSTPAAAPSISGPEAAAKGGSEIEALYQQALAMESSGKAADAVRVYRRAARAGHGKAAKRLGEIFDKGAPGVSRDYAESLQWYEMARQLGEASDVAGRR